MTTMTVLTSDNPSSHERHLLRKVNSPLFNDGQIDLSDDLLRTAQNKDRNFQIEYQKEFHDVLEQTVALKPNEESDVILKLKERLDKLYEMSAAIADKQDDIRPAIVQLLQVIMATIRKAAGNDTQAQDKLDQEEMAREAHFKLLESSLVADLLNPNSPIDSAELTPTLLSVEKNDLQLAIQILDQTQLLVLVNDAETILDKLKQSGEHKSRAENNLAVIKGHIDFLNANTDL